MRKEILAEEFVNASNEYEKFCNALWELYEDDPIMTCLLGELNILAGNYYNSMNRLYEAGMTLDEASHLEKGI